MADYYESIISESTNPQVVLDDGVPDVLIHASFGVGKGKYLNELLWIPIEFTEDRGTILSAYFVPKIKGDVIRVVEWRKKK